jgi:hypothetical protein
LENPGSGLLRQWLGPPRFCFQPHAFGDAHTKLTAVWGKFVIPELHWTRPTKRMPGKNARERAITPQGFANAFFEANKFK